jgi:hypothetical protein
MFTTANIKKIPENFKKEIFGKFFYENVIRCLRNGYEVRPYIALNLISCPSCVSTSYS